MSSWGNNNNAANAPRWAVATSGISLRANSNNVTLLFGNTTPNAFRTNTTFGLYGLDANNVSGGIGIHPRSEGWVLEMRRTVGGVVRTTYEVLVSTNTMLGGGSDKYNPNNYITIVTAPSANSNKSGVGNTVTFKTVATGSNPGQTLTYAWLFANSTGVYTYTSGNTLFTGNTSNTLIANAYTTVANGLTVYVSVGSPGANATYVNSAPVLITVT
jgi:hypothetical protein